ncbi:hypothetical protein Tco_0699158 [Tanacetum coccineum]
MVAYLEKLEGKQFWQTVALSTNEDGVRGITTTTDRKVKVFVSEASIRRHLKLEDSEGLKTLPTAKIFKQLALMGVDIPLFLTMLTAPESSPSRITSSPSLSPQTHPSTSQPPSTPQSNQTTPVTEDPIPHESPLQSVHSFGPDEGSLSLNELTDLCTSLSKKKLEHTIKISQARMRAKVVISDAEEDEEDPSNQGRSLIEELERRREVSTISGGVSTTSRLVSAADISTASELESTAGVKAKDKGKAIMHESEPPKKIKKREARFKAEQEQERIDFETTLELQKKLDEREEVAAKNQGGYKMSHFKRMSYEDIRAIFERVWDQNQAFIPMVEEEIVQQDDVIAEQAVKESSRTARGRRKKPLARKRARETISEESAKKHKLEDDTEKE